MPSQANKTKRLNIKETHSVSLDPRYFCVLRFAFCFFFFFSFLHAFQTFRGQANSRVLFGPVFFYFSVNQWVRALFMDPQISFFINFFIKNGSHSTIHTFKNYFTTVFSVFSFSKISSIQTDPKCGQWSISNDTDLN